MKLECERPKKGSVEPIHCESKLRWGKQAVAAKEDEDENDDEDDPIRIISPDMVAYQCDVTV